MPQQKVGVIGSGAMGREHTAAWHTLGIPVTVFSRTAGTRAAFARSTGAAEATTLEELLATVDIVDICTPTDTHADLVRAAAAAGRHVICEKPLGRTAAESRDLVDTCTRAGVALHVGHVLRFFPEYAAAAAAVSGGRIGTPAVVRLSRRVPWPEPGAWVTDDARSGGILVDLMIHEYDYARWIAGDVVRVFATTVTREGGGFARGYAILTHAGGAITHVQGEWGRPETGARTTLEISGDAGVLQYDSDGDPSFHLATNDPPGQEPMPPYADQLAEFLGAITEGSPTRVDPQDAMAAVRIALAAEESGRTGSAVEVAR